MKKFPVQKRRPSVARLALCVLLLATGLIGCDAESPTRPNLVLITVDRLAADRLRCFGGASDAGGSVCALGKQGTLFAWTASPGRGEASGAATVLTGLPEAIHGVAGDGLSFLASGLPSIAEDLSGVGYATAAFVTSPRVNRSRRLDRGFDLYDDRLASPSRKDDAEIETGSIDLASKARAWIDAAPSPWFVWIHADRDAGLVELDRLFSRLSQTLDDEERAPGILFLALRGESEPVAPEIETTTDADQVISWRTHRVPLIWRPPTVAHSNDGPAPAAVSRRLASLMDVVPTLRASAHLPTTDPSGSGDDSGRVASPLRGAGRDLGAGAVPQREGTSSEERFLLLRATAAGTDVGLASQHHLYTRHTSPLDGTGRPVPTSSLIPLAARFATLPQNDPLRNPAPDTAKLEPAPWRRDVLGADSPVPRLEFYLARQLGAERNTNQKRDLQ